MHCPQKNDPAYAGRGPTGSGTCFGGRLRRRSRMGIDRRLDPLKVIYRRSDYGHDFATSIAYIKNNLLNLVNRMIQSVGIAGDDVRPSLHFDLAGNIHVLNLNFHPVEQEDWREQELGLPDIRSFV